MGGVSRRAARGVRHTGSHRLSGLKSCQPQPTRPFRLAQALVLDRQLQDTRSFFVRTKKLGERPDPIATPLLHCYSSSATGGLAESVFHASLQMNEGLPPRGPAVQVKGVCRLDDGPGRIVLRVEYEYRRRAARD
jgi:hypothetical protein